MARRLTSTTRWLRWLTPGLQIKRWLVLLMVSELVLVLGVAYALKEIYQTAHLPSGFYYITLQFLPYWARAIMFGIFGVGLLLVSYLKLTQSVLGPFLPGNTTTSVVEVIHAFRLRGRGPRVVAIGGGTGLSSLLRGLKMYTSNLSAIVTVADDGGSSGRLRDEYRILPPGDFRQCLIALADAEPLMKQLFDHRFKEGSLNGHAFGNLFIMAMADVTGNFEQALRESGKVLAVKGTIVPSTLQDVTLVASINGSTVEGESKIPKQHAPISHVFLKPDGVQVNPEAAQAILNAELITVGPGSLYTHLNPNQFAAFPSLHAAFPALAAVYAWNRYRPLAIGLVAWTTAVLLSIVYLGEHYVVDALDGFLYVAVATILVEAFVRWRERRRATPATPSA